MIRGVPFSTVEIVGIRYVDQIMHSIYNYREKKNKEERKWLKTVKRRTRINKL
jgi:hypothetical protein